VPCIGGDGLGEGCDATRDFIDSALIPYTVSTANIVERLRVATARTPAASCTTSGEHARRQRHHAEEHAGRHL
jgi:hypothetical protein